MWECGSGDEGMKWKGGAENWLYCGQDPYRNKFKRSLNIAITSLRCTHILPAHKTDLFEWGCSLMAGD